MSTKDLIDTASALIADDKPRRFGEIGQQLRDVPFAHVLTSPLLRSRQTCAFAGFTPTGDIEPDLAEWDYGDYEGRTPGDVPGSRPGWILFRDGSPGGETPALISERADHFIARLRLQRGNVALFSHGHFGRVLAARWIGLSVRHARHFLLSTASISVPCYKYDRTDQPVIGLGHSPSRDAFNTAPIEPAIGGERRWRP